MVHVPADALDFTTLFSALAELINELSNELRLAEHVTVCESGMVESKMTVKVILIVAFATTEDAAGVKAGRVVNTPVEGFR